MIFETLLRSAGRVLADSWSPPHPAELICPGCGCCCAPAVGVLFLHKSTRSSVSRDACAGSTAAWAENLSVAHLDSPPGALPAQGELLQPGWIFSLGSCPGRPKQIPWKSPGSELEPGVPLAPGVWWFFLCYLQSYILPFPLLSLCQWIARLRHSLLPLPFTQHRDKDSGPNFFGPGGGQGPNLACLRSLTIISSNINYVLCAKPKNVQLELYEKGQIRRTSVLVTTSHKQVYRNSRGISENYRTQIFRFLHTFSGAPAATCYPSLPSACSCAQHWDN